MRGFLLCFIFAPGVRIFARRVIRVTLAAFSILPELSCLFPVHFAISLFRVKKTAISVPSDISLIWRKKGMSICCPFSINGLVIRATARKWQARRAFLDAGHYQPLRDAIVAQLRERLDDKATAVLDIGCGEGYYTHVFADVLPEITTFGLDVSKVAIKAAAKRYPQVTFCVASSHRLPFSDTSMDAIIRIYAPCKAEELARVVKPGGWVITATPGPRHLMELKGLIYNEVHLHAPHAEQLEGFTLQQSAELCYPMRLRGDEAVALLQMTPFAWRAKPEVWQTLAAKEVFDCQTDFNIHLWQRSY